MVAEIIKNGAKKTQIRPFSPRDRPEKSTKAKMIKQNNENHQYLLLFFDTSDQTAPKEATKPNIGSVS